MKENTDNIKVLVRVRPFDQREQTKCSTLSKCVFANEQANVIDLRGKTNNAQGTFKFDFVRNEQASQRAIFATVGESVVEKFLEGFHGCVIAYGQTGAGKTYTMQGFGGGEKNNNHRDEGEDDNNNVGLIPRALRRIFEFTRNDAASGEEDVTHEVTCAYLEIYNEQLTDLLSNEDGNGDGIAMDGMMMEDNNGNHTGSIPSFGSFSGGELAIREDPKKGTFVENLTKVKVNSAEETYEAFLRGSARRRVGETEMNRNSSRSHSVFSVTLTSTTRGRTTKEKKRTLHLVDLAGSERQKATEAIGARLKEASAINKSLSALGNVIKSLVDVANGRERHVPFRDSKLTWLLKDALGGNAKCAVIACVSPSLINADETASTLKFANRAKLVKVRAQVNERAFHNHVNFGNTPYKGKANDNNDNNANAMDAEVTRLRSMIDEIVATTATTTTASSNSVFLAAALGDDANMEDGGENTTTTASSKIAEFVLTGMKRASALEKNILETNRANLAWQRDAVAKQTQLELKVNDLNELVERLEQNISSTQMVLKLREASLKKHGIDKDDVDRELVELRKLVSVPPEVVKLRMELAQVTERLERAEAEASSSNTKGEYAKMVEELNRMRAINVDQSELASAALEQKLWFEKEKIALLENLREVENKVELAELRAVEAEANQFRAENAKSEAERAYTESQKITDDAVKEKARVESTFAENKQVMEEMFARLEEETKKRDEIETECETLREASQSIRDQMVEKSEEMDALKEKLQFLEAETEKSKSALRDSESSLQNALGKQNDLVSETETKLKASEMELVRLKEEMMQEKSQMQKSMEEEIAKARKAAADEIEAMKVKLDEEKASAMKAVELDKEAMSEAMKRMKVEMQTLQETTDERVQAAENIAKEKLALELKALEEETERVARERANLEASFDAKRVELEHSFEEKERQVTSACEMKVAASKAAAASEFKAAAALQLKVKELTRKIEEMKEENNKSDAMATTATFTTRTTTTASTPPTMKATTTTATTTTNTNTSQLLKSGGARRVLQPLNHSLGSSEEHEDDREDNLSFHASKKPRTFIDGEDDDDGNPRSPLVRYR